MGSTKRTEIKKSSTNFKICYFDLFISFSWIISIYCLKNEELAFFNWFSQPVSLGKQFVEAQQNQSDVVNNVITSRYFLKQIMHYTYFIIFKLLTSFISIE